MPNVLPSDQNVEFILCENVRPEGDGKISILGYIATPEIIVPATAATQVGVNGITLGLIFILRDGEGTFPGGSISLTDPAGMSLGQGALNPIEKKIGEANIIFINVPLMPVTTMGDYLVTLNIDTKTYVRKIKIRH